MSTGVKIAVGVAVLVVLAAVGSAANEQFQEKQQARALLVSVDAMVQRQNAQGAALDARFGQIDLDHRIEPTALLNADGVADARAELAKYRGLLAERDHLAASADQERQALFASLPAGKIRDAAFRGSARVADSHHAIAAALSKAQIDNADAVQAYVDWFDVHRGDLHVRNGKLTTVTQQEVDEVRVLGERLASTGQAVDAAIVPVKTMVQQSTQKLQQAHQDIDQ